MFSSADQPVAGEQRSISRVLLAVLALVGLATGGWAAAAPLSFYADFPGFRHGWVSADGAFDEHLIRDVGAMFLALGVLAAIAAASRSVLLARTAGASWTVFNAVHFVYHVGHLSVYDTLDRILNAVGLAAAVAISLVITLLPPRAAHSD